MGGTSKWKLPRPLYLFRDMESLTYVDVSDIRNLQMAKCETLNNQDDLIVVILYKILGYGIIFH